MSVMNNTIITLDEVKPAPNWWPRLSTCDTAATSGHIAMWSTHARERKSNLIARILARISMAGFRDKLLLDNIVPGSSILDVGCGGGRPLLAEIGSLVVGIDPEPLLVSQARQAYTRAHKGSAEKLPFSDNTFDTVVSIDVFGHMREKRKAACEIFRVLAPGGMVVLTAEVASNGWLDAMCKTNPVLFRRNSIERPGRWFLETARTTVEHFEKSGFTSIKTEPVQALIPECGILSALLDGYEDLPRWLRLFVQIDRAFSRHRILRELMSLAMTPAAFLNQIEPLSNGLMITVVARKPGILNPGENSRGNPELSIHGDIKRQPQAAFPAATFRSATCDRCCALCN